MQAYLLHSWQNLLLIVWMINGFCQRHVFRQTELPRPFDLYSSPVCCTQTSNVCGAALKVCETEVSIAASPYVLKPCMHAGNITRLMHER